MRYRTAAVIGLFALAAAAGGCISSSHSPTAPTTPPNTGVLTGTWSGDLTLLGTSARMTWTLTQAGTAATGNAIVLLPTGTVLMNGTFNGTLSGNSLTYTITIGAGGIPTQPTCTGQLGGNGTVNSGSNSSSIAATYTVTATSCAIPLSTGTFTLTKTS